MYDDRFHTWIKADMKISNVCLIWFLMDKIYNYHIKIFKIAPMPFHISPICDVTDHARRPVS